MCKRLSTDWITLWTQKRLYHMAIVQTSQIKIYHLCFILYIVIEKNFYKKSNYQSIVSTPSVTIFAQGPEGPSHAPRPSPFLLRGPKGPPMPPLPLPFLLKRPEGPPARARRKRPIGRLSSSHIKNQLLAFLDNFQIFLLFCKIIFFRNNYPIKMLKK